MGRSVRYAWAGPTTLIGLGLVLLALRRGRVQLTDGVIEAHGPAIRQVLGWMYPRPLGVAAITLGHVVLGIDEAALDATRDHQLVHVAQDQRWGPLLVPAYLLSSAWAVLRGRHPYLDNGFEREAWRHPSAKEVLRQASRGAGS